MTTTNQTDPTELIRQLAAEGHTPRYIAKALDLRCIKPPHGGRFWQESTVRKIAARCDVTFSGSAASRARAATATTGSTTP